MEQYACVPFLVAPIHMQLLKCSTRTKFQGTNDECEFSRTRSEISMSPLGRNMHRHRQPQRPCFPFQTELTSNTEASSGVLRNISDQGTFVKWCMAADPRAKFNHYSRSDIELNDSPINWYSNLLHILI